MLLYKICTKEQWEAAERNGVFSGTPNDLRDGYIHLSTVEQSGATIRKYFRGQTSLVMLTIDTDKLGSEIRWEKSATGRRGDFPHFYGQIPVSAIVDTAPFDAPE